MSESNARLLRKKYARLVEDEIRTVNIEIDQIIDRIKNVDYKTLKLIDYSNLRRLRSSIQTIRSKIEEINSRISIIEEQRTGHIRSVIIKKESDNDIEILVDEYEYLQFEKDYTCKEAGKEKELRTINIKATSEKPQAKNENRCLSCNSEKGINSDGHICEDLDLK